MTEPAAQSYAKHTKWDSKFHFFLAPLLALLLLFAIYQAWRRTDGLTLGFLVLVIAVFTLAFITRLYSLKVQDRVIRLEERLRIAGLAPPLQPRLSELSEDQLIGLRFACDAEVAALAERALNEKLTRDAVKKAVVNWRTDSWRI